MIYWTIPHKVWGGLFRNHEVQMTRFILYGTYSSYDMTNPFRVISAMSANHLITEQAQIVLDWCIDNDIWHAVELNVLRRDNFLSRLFPSEYIILNIIIEDYSHACFMRLRFPELKFGS